MSNIKDTYIVINGDLTGKLRQIKHFKLDLGNKLLLDNKQLMPVDVNIQKHLIYFEEFIYLTGYIGTLPIYTNTKLEINTIMVCNSDDHINYTINDEETMYDNINNALNILFNKINKTPDVTTVVEIKTTEKENIKVKKPLSEMTEAERIAFARGLN